MDIPSWRSAFIELCEAIFRELGFDPPAMLHDDNLPLAMELEVDQRGFELVHSSSNRTDRILVICKLGSMPSDHGEPELSALLAKNLGRVRDFRPCFGINADSGEVVWTSYESLDKLRGSVMLEKLRSLAAEAVGWQERVFLQRSVHDEFGAEVSGVTLA